MGRYIVFLCSRCGMPRYAREGQRTAKCPYCNFQIRLDKIRILCRVEDSRAAREIVKKYKAKILIRRGMRPC